MSPFDLGALLLLAAAVIGLVNERWIGLPQPVCLLLGAIGVSLAILAVDPLVPYDLTGLARAALDRVDLPGFLLDGVLAFLLFAASLHVSLNELRSNRLAIVGLAVGGVMISTVLFGGLLWAVLRAGAVQVPLGWCLLLGAILAPTDAVVVDGLLRRVKLAPALKAAISGESLFNDGVGVVIFLVALAGVQGATGLVGHGTVALRLLVESAGGGAIGVLTGLVAAAAIRRAASYNVALTVSLALVLVTYRAAQAAGVSGPIAVVAAGLVIGGDARTEGARRQEIVAFWAVVDELLNAMLFLLIGFQTLAVGVQRALLPAVLLCIPLSLLARGVSVAVPMLLLRIRTGDRGRGIAVLTWAGLRGGVSVALALGVPAGPYRAFVVTGCYAVVVFSIVVQGLSMPRVIDRIGARGRTD